MQASVTVIIVNYNAGEWLQRCLTSLVGIPEIKHVAIVDNRSTDISLDLIQPLIDSQPDHFTLIENIQNRGFAAANNQILKNFVNDMQSQGEYVLLLNPDCEIHSDVLSTLINEFNQRADYGMLGCLIKNEDGSIQDTCRRRFPTPKSALVKMLQLSRLGLAEAEKFNLGADVPAEFVETEALSGAFMLVRQQALKEVGLLDEAYFMHCEDLDWCMRFKKKGWKIGFSPDVSIIHAKGVSSKSRPIGVLYTLHKGMARYFDKFYRDQYSLGFRVLVKVGICASFTIRALFSSLKTLIFQSDRKSAWKKRYR